MQLREFTAADAGCIREWITTPQALMLWAGPSFRWPLDDDQLAEYVAESDGVRRRS